MTRKRNKVKGTVDFSTWNLDAPQRVADAMNDALSEVVQAAIEDNAWIWFNALEDEKGAMTMDVNIPLTATDGDDIVWTIDLKRHIKERIEGRKLVDGPVPDHEREGLVRLAVTFETLAKMIRKATTG